MYQTKNDISSTKRKKIAELLNQLLSDAIDLKSQAKQAHWNVKGETFIALHELFDQVSTQADDAVDLIAERVVQLGEVAIGTVKPPCIGPISELVFGINGQSLEAHVAQRNGTLNSVPVG